MLYHKGNDVNFVHHDAEYDDVNIWRDENGNDKIVRHKEQHFWSNAKYVHFCVDDSDEGVDGNTNMDEDININN